MPETTKKKNTTAKQRPVEMRMSCTALAQRNIVNDIYVHLLWILCLLLCNAVLLEILLSFKNIISDQR